jgi:ABC-type uncharacterized transport system YnjBCD substrate-binding protein
MTNLKEIIANEKVKGVIAIVATVIMVNVLKFAAYIIYTHNKYINWEIIMRKVMYVITLVIVMNGISEGMDTQQENLSDSNTTGQVELAPEQAEVIPPAMPITLAQEYVQNLQLNELPSLRKVSKAIKETHFRTYWRNKGNPGKGSEYSKKVASLLLEKIPQTDTRENFQKVRNILNRISSGSVGTESLTIKDCSFLKLPDEVLNSIGIW